MTSDNAPILITGGAGFIGARLARRLARLGHPVTVFDSFTEQVHGNGSAARAGVAVDGISVLHGDVRDRDLIERALRASRARTVIHLAAETGTGQSHTEPAHYVDVNVTGTARLVEAIRNVGGVRRVILSGSRAVYGEGACVDRAGLRVTAVARREADLAVGDYAPKDRVGRSLRPVATAADTPAAPTSIYASTKLMQEYLLTQGLWGSGTHVGLLRMQNVYGPGQALSNPYTGVLSVFARKISEGEKLEVFEDGAITRDFVYVDDAVEAFVSMVQTPVVTAQPIDIGSGKATTLLEIAGKLLETMEGDRDGLHVTGAYRPGDVRHALADISTAKAVLGWRPNVDLDSGLVRFAEWAAAAPKHAVA